MRKVININDNWTFEKNGRGEIVQLPHSFNAVDGQETADYYRGRCCYTKILPPMEDKTYIEFGAANSVAEVYVNNTKVGEHRGGYSLFRFDITPYLSDSLDNIIKVYVDNSDFQDIYPSNADFTFYGGIYRDVKLITSLSDCHFSLKKGLYGLKAIAKVNGEKGEVSIEPTIENKSYEIKATYTLFDANGKEVAATTVPSTDVKVKLFLDNPQLWNSVEDPYLYTLRAALTQNDEKIDEVEFKIGFRTITFDSEKGCFLNGKHIKLKGVSRHQDRFHMGNALNEKEHREDLEIIKDLGANSIRLAHYQHDQIFYDICDEMGFIVWAEIPVISMYSERKLDNAVSQLTELITQNINHPSIYCWSVQNEITISGVTKSLESGINKLNYLAHTLDPSRPTASAQFMMNKTSSSMNEITDILGYNLYFGWYMQTFNAIDAWLDKFHSENPKIKLCLSEYGAEGIIKYQNDYGIQGDYSETYQARFHEHYARAINERDWLWGSYVWNMFDFGAANRDEGGVKGRNNKGLVTLDRKIRKDSFYVYKAFWSDSPFVHMGGERYTERLIGKTNIPVYSNLDEVTLIINGESITKKCDKVVYFEGVNIVDGENIVKAIAGDCSHEYKIIGVTKENEEYKLTDSGSFVKNWFQSDDGNIKPDYFSVNDSVGELLKSQEVQTMIKTLLGDKKIPPVAFVALKPFKVKTLIKLLKLDSEMESFANQFLQTIKK